MYWPIAANGVQVGGGIAGDVTTGSPTVTPAVGAGYVDDGGVCRSRTWLEGTYVVLATELDDPLPGVPGPLRLVPA